MLGHYFMFGFCSWKHEINVKYKCVLKACFMSSFQKIDLIIEIVKTRRSKESFNYAAHYDTRYRYKISVVLVWSLLTSGLWFSMANSFSIYLFSVESCSPDIVCQLQCSSDECYDCSSLFSKKKAINVFKQFCLDYTKHHY